MKQEERAGRIFRSLHLITEAEKLLNDIIWEDEKEQPDNYDKLQKLEQVMLGGCHYMLKSTFEALEELYKSYRYNTFNQE